MNSFQQIIQQFKQDKRSFFNRTFGLVLLLFGLTSLQILVQILNQLDQQGSLAVGKIKAFTAGEAAELQSYFMKGIWILWGVAFLFFILTTLWDRKKHPLKLTTNKPSPKSVFFGDLIRFSLPLLVASCILLGLFILLQPLYETVLQLFYQHSLDCFTNLPKFVLSNGNSGFAYSLRFPLSFDISSDLLFRFFLIALATACSQFFILALPIFFSDNLVRSIRKKLPLSHHEY